MDAPLVWAFTAGLVATVNPCGFPMLPAYLSYFTGTDDTDADRDGRVPRALLAAGAVSLGFVAVFSALGVPIHAGFTWIYRMMPWFTLLVGGALLVLGVGMLAGRRLKVALPRLERGGSSRRFGSMVLFGASYAVASLSCTLPVFLVVVAGTAARSSPLSGLAAFVAYAAGMSVVLVVLSVALALARESMVRRMRRALRYADRAAGVLLVAVGAYLLYYGVHAMDPTNPATTSGVGVVDGWSATAATWLAQHAGGVALVALALAVGGLTWSLVAGRRPAREGISIASEAREPGSTTAAGEKASPAATTVAGERSSPAATIVVGEPTTTGRPSPGDGPPARETTSTVA